MWAHLNAPRPRPSAIHPELAEFDAVVATAMAKDPDERFASAGALATAVINCGASPATGVPVTVQAPPRHEAAATHTGQPAADRRATVLEAAPMRTPPAEVPTLRSGSRRTLRPFVAVVAVLTPVGLGALSAALIAGTGPTDGRPSTAAGGTRTATTGTTTVTTSVTSTATTTTTTAATATATTTQPTTASTNAVDLEPLAAADYAAMRPAGWTTMATDKQLSGYVENRWHAPGDGSVQMKIDHSPSSGKTAWSSAKSVREYFSDVSSYRELGFEATELAGRPAVRWEFTVDDDGVTDRRVDYFVNGCGHDFAIWGSAPDDAFSSYAPTFDAVATSVAEGQTGC